MLLSELIKGLDYEEIIGETNAYISGISINSKKVQKNYLFICISGTNYDSHNSISEAENYGAAAIVTERRTSTCLTQIVVKDSRAAMSRLASEFYGNPSEKMKIIGVTGTNGKTTTTHVIKNILESAGHRVGLIGTLGVYFGNTFYEPTLTTPDPLELHKIFKEMYSYGIDYVVMEVSAHAIDLKKVDDVFFEVGVFTNLTQDHLDYFGTMENYKRAKTSFFDGKHCKYAVINSDDETGRELIRSNSSFLSYGIDNPADAFAVNIRERIDGTYFVINIFDSVYEVKLPLLGRFNIYNALAAALAAGALGVRPKEIAAALSLADAVPGRLELVTVEKGVSVFVDYAHTPDGLENSLKALKRLTENRLICVFGCGGNRDTGKRALMGGISGKYADFTVITSDNPRYEEPMDIIRQIESGLLRETKEYVIVQKREKAIEYALGMANRGDVVLVAGKGAEKYQDILGIKHVYNDKDCIKNIYRELRF